MEHVSSESAAAVGCNSNLQCCSTMRLQGLTHRAAANSAAELQAEVSLVVAGMHRRKSAAAVPQMLYVWKMVDEILMWPRCYDQHQEAC
jgi:hypothetical protein